MKRIVCNALINGINTHHFTAGICAVARSHLQQGHVVVMVTDNHESIEKAAQIHLRDLATDVELNTSLVNVMHPKDAPAAMRKVKEGWPNHTVMLCFDIRGSNAQGERYVEVTRSPFPELNFSELYLREAAELADLVATTYQWHS